MVEQTITIKQKEYNQLKRAAQIDIELLRQFMDSFKDIKEGRVRRVK